MATAAPLKIEHVSPKRLNPAKYNPRKMSEKAHAALRRGVEAFGLVDPIIARRSDNLVIGGHQRCGHRSGNRVIWQQADKSRSDRRAVVLTGEPVHYEPPYD